MTHGRIRAAATAVLLAPPLSLMGGRLAVALAVSIPALPGGIHTYIPAAVLVSMPLLVALSLVSLAVALTAARGARVRPLEWGLWLLGGQALVHILQLAVVDRLQGVPDAAGPLALGIVVPGILLVVMALLVRGMGLILVAPSISAATRVFTTAAPRPHYTPLPLFSLDRQTPVSRRGPPHSLSV